MQIQLAGGKQQVSQPRVVDSRRDDTAPQVDVVDIRQEHVHGDGDGKQRGDVPAVGPSQAGRIALAGAHQEEQAGPDHETGGQAHLQDDPGNVRPEIEGHRLPGSHTYGQDQQRQPALRGFALGLPPQERGRADATEGTEHGEEKQEMLAQHGRCVGDVGFGKVATLQREGNTRLRRTTGRTCLHHVETLLGLVRFDWDAQWYTLKKQGSEDSKPT